MNVGYSFAIPAWALVWFLIVFTTLAAALIVAMFFERRF